MWSCKYFPILILAGLTFSQIPTNVTLTRQFTGVSLSRPLWMSEVPTIPGSFYVLEQMTAAVVLLEPNGNNWRKTTVYSVSVRTQNEEGLLGFALHPNFATNRKYYIYYSPSGGSRRSDIQERTLSGNFKTDAGTSKTILSISQPEWNHNGGHIEFGKDGFLYIGVGDGGGSGDNHGTIGNGQNRNTLLGKILRIDVDKSANGNNYAIPSDNPFVGQSGTRDEIWALGLRNPWRMSFDPLNGDLWVGDVGQNVREEIDIVKKGQNMGWRVREGMICYNASSCNSAGMTGPIIDYPRGDGISVTGGYVFRANPASVFYGVYIFGDFGTNRIWALPYNNGVAGTKVQIARTSGGIASFAVDARGQIYSVNLNGSIYLLDHPQLKPVVGIINQKLKQGSKPLFHKSPLGYSLDKQLLPYLKGLKVYRLDGSLILEKTGESMSSPLNLESGVYSVRLAGLDGDPSRIVYFE